MGQASVSFGNLQLTAGFTMTFSDGVRPSVCIIEAPLEGGNISPDIVKISDLVIQQDDVTRTFVDCHLQDALLDANMSGQTWHLPILDRRWQWQFPRISGQYNVKQGDESLLREKTPQDLLKLLFAQLGENADVSVCENTVRPSVDWDSANVADEIDRLCADLGCTVNIDQDGSRRVWLTNINTGADLPPGPALGGGHTISARPLPSDVVVIADRTLFEDTFVTEAVGLDVDYQYRTLDTLSYKPKAGWGSQDPTEFQDLQPGDADIAADGVSAKPGGPLTFKDPITGEWRFLVELAKQTVYRTWRITGIGIPGFWIPLFGGTIPGPELTPTSYKDLDVKNERAATIIIDSEKIALPSLAQALHWDDDTGGNVSGIYRHGHSLDAKRGVFHTSTPLVIYWDDVPVPLAGLVIPAHWEPGSLEVTTGFHAGHDGIFIRHEVSLPVPGFDGNPFQDSPVTFYRRELRRRIINGATTAQDNVKTLETEMNAYAKTILQRLAIPPSTNVTYEKIMAIDTDGQIRQVIYSGGGLKAATTTVSKGRPFNIYAPTAEGLRLPGNVNSALRRTARK